MQHSAPSGGRIVFDDENSNTQTSDTTEIDPRLTKAITMVRKMTSPQLKEQTVTAEWVVLKSDVEKDILLEAVQEVGFWREVKAITAADMEALSSEKGVQVDTNARLMQMFKCFDKKETGEIDSTQLHQMLLYMGITVSEKGVKEVLRQYDTNLDGLITKREFLQVMEAAQAGELPIGAPTSQNIRRASFRLRKEASEGGPDGRRSSWE